MTDTATPSRAPRPGMNASSFRTARILATVTGLLGLLLALLTPILPITQTTAQLNWPQAGSVNSVTAPLVGYQPVELEAALPCTLIEDALESDDREVLLATAPTDASEGGIQRAMFVSAGSDSVEVRTRNILVGRFSAEELADSGCAELTVTSNEEATTAALVGGDGEDVVKGIGGDHRPQTVGVFTDLTGDAPAGLEFSAEIDSRYSSSPTVVKIVAMVLAVLLTLISLITLARLDQTDGRRHRRFLPRRWWRFDLKDGVVVGVLVLWHFIGANTADDGYILTMARAAEHSGYMSNYYRWFAAPELPFGASYYMFTLLHHISPASILLRLPALIAGILAWLVISREVLPRLGRRARSTPVVAWTGGLLFLAFWLPLNNGLRPEPYIALGALLVWVSIERAIATRRVLPIAVALIIAGLTLSVGPTGTIAAAALLAAARPLVRVIVARAKEIGWGATLAPLLASGTVILTLVFADTTIRSVLDATSMKTDLGPAEEWYMEYLRYEALMTTSPDGSNARRFAVFTMLLCLITCAAMLFRKGRIPGAALGPSRRIVGITAISLAVMMFNPTKWSHHFGVYAGFAGALGALTALAVASTALRSGRNRALFTAALMFVMALSFETSNSWWYVSNYAVPFGGHRPEIGGIKIASVFIALMIIALVVALVLHVREPFVAKRREADGDAAGARSRVQKLSPLVAAPLTVMAAFMLIFQIATMSAAIYLQWPGFTVGKGNLDSLRGNVCAQGDEVLVEPDPNAGMLTADVPAAEALTAGGSQRFTPDGLPTDLSSELEWVQPGVVGTGSDSKRRSNSAGTGGGRNAEPGVNGSHAALPFGLDPETTPVVGSFDSSDQSTAWTTTAWYELPENAVADDELLVVSAAGRINDWNLRVEFGRADGDDYEVLGDDSLIDIGPSPSWRNLRLPLDDAPEGTTAVRLVALDDNPSLNEWLAFTPPRIAQTQTLQQYVGSDAPVLLDWAVALAFPCQRPFNHLNGVAEKPEFRILPDRGLAVSSTNTWQDDIGGGPLGWTGLLLDAETVPSYQNNDWDRDWGSLERFVPRVPDATEAELELGEATRHGLWAPAQIKHAYK